MTEATLPLRRPLRHRIEAGAAYLAFALLSLLPSKTISAVGGWLGRTIGPMTRAHQTAKNNLQRALPDMAPPAQTSVLTSAWENFGRTMTEYAVLTRLYANNTVIDLSGHEALSALAAQGKPAILFGAHLGNWETTGVALALHSKPLFIVYRAANNPLVDNIISDVRKSYAAGMARKGSSGARQIMKALSGGQHVVMMIDQKLNTGMEVPLFGHGAFTGTAVVRMAARFGCPVFPVRTERTDDFQFKVTVEEPLAFTDESDEGVRAALTQINRHLEGWIKERPGQWMWMHKRWPN